MTLDAQAQRVRCCLQYLKLYILLDTLGTLCVLEYLVKDRPCDCIIILGIFLSDPLPRIQYAPFFAFVALTVPVCLLYIIR